MSNIEWRTYWPQQCAKCHGLGSLRLTVFRYVKCAACHGTGYVLAGSTALPKGDSP